MGPPARAERATETMGPLAKEPLESAKTAQDPAARGDLPASRGMPTACFDAFGIEIPVKLQGERTGANAHGATDTYHEDACTVIVFPQGAVLRSSANLTIGQHLLLKNQETNQEVPCRVVNLRSYSTGYVEIEFIRPAPGFWGIVFPSEAPKPAGARVASPAVAPPKQAATPSPAPVVKTPAGKTSAPPPKLASLPAATVPAASPVVKEQTVRPPSIASSTPHPAQASSFSAVPFHEQETLPIADLVAIGHVESAPARSDRAAGTTASPSSLGSFEEKEHRAMLSYGKSSPFQVFSAEEGKPDEFSLGVTSPVRERSPRWKPILIAASVTALGLVLGIGAGFLRRHSRKSAVVAANLSPVVTPALEQPSPVAQPQIAASPSVEAVQTPMQTPPSMNSDGQPSKQTPPAITETVASQPKSKAPDATKAAPKPFFKLIPHASTPERAAVSRETTQPPAPGDEAAGSPTGQADVSNGIMTDALRSGTEVPAPPALAKTPERVGGDVKLPQLLHMVPPSYPLAAKQSNQQGEVTVQAVIDGTGKVTEAKVVSGPALLQQAAVDAVRRWKYEPATLDGKPVPMQVVVKVKFHLN